MECARREAVSTRAAIISSNLLGLRISILRVPTTLAGDICRPAIAGCMWRGDLDRFAARRSKRSAAIAFLLRLRRLWRGAVHIGVWGDTASGGAGRCGLSALIVLVLIVIGVSALVN